MLVRAHRQPRRARTGVHLRRRLAAGVTAVCFAVPVALVTHAPLHALAAGLTLTGEVSSDLMPILTAPPVTTTAANEALVAFVSENGAASVTAVTGGGLTWTRAVRANGATATGSAEIWWAIKAGAGLVTPAIVATSSIPGFGGSITVAGFTNNNTTTPISAAVNGSSGTLSGAPTSSLTTLWNNSLVWAVGLDTSTPQQRTVGTVPAQTIVNDYPDLQGNGDYWVQSVATAATTTAGTVVPSNDTAPINGPWDLASAEIRSLAGTSPPVLDFAVTTSNLNPSFRQLTSPPISTSVSNQVLVAFLTVAPTGGCCGGFLSLSGGGLQWARADQNQSGAGFLEVWYAVAYAPVAAVQVTALINDQFGPGSITVAAFSGIDLENPVVEQVGSSGVGGTAGNSLTTTRNGSWVWGLGTNGSNATGADPRPRRDH